jgi:hypothetical protein
MKDILSRRSLPEKFRVAIAKNIENHLFSKVLNGCLQRFEEACRESPQVFSWQLKIRI